MAHTYSHLYKIPTTGLRFFTVYGPWGRPDMAPILFATAISKGDPIKVFNNGNMERDFTYIDDIVEGIKRLIPLSNANHDNKLNGRHPEGGTTEGTSLHTSDLKKLEANYNIFNIGNGSPVNLLTFIKTMEKAMEKEAEKIMMPMQPGDVTRTWADVNKLETMTRHKTIVDIKKGVLLFIKWFKEYNTYQN